MAVVINEMEVEAAPETPVAKQSEASANGKPPEAGEVEKVFHQQTERRLRVWAH
jgi:hypothetical protein